MFFSKGEGLLLYHMANISEVLANEAMIVSNAFHVIL